MMLIVLKMQNQILFFNLQNQQIENSQYFFWFIGIHNDSAVDIELE